MSEYRRVQNDTGRPIKDTLATDGEPDGLTAAEVVFTMWEPDGPVLIEKNSDNVEVEPEGEGDGAVNYNFDEGDLDTPGVYYFEWEVTFADGTNVTYRGPHGRPKLLVILPEGA